MIHNAAFLCAEIEKLCPKWGFHVALTGGVLYKEGDRKDIDILFYRIRQVTQEEAHSYIDKMFEDLNSIGLTKVGGFGWCHKAKWRDIDVDCFFPEEEGGVYHEEEEDNTENEVIITTTALGGLTPNTIIIDDF
jgi:hypothetical protein